MKVLVYLHHPAHFHLFKNIIKKLQTSGHDIIILATKKDILEELLQNEKFEYINVLPKGRRDNRFAIVTGLLKQDLRLLKICLKLKPEILIGTSTEITHIGWLLKIPNIFLNEDDLEVVPLVGKVAYPFAKHIISPDVCNTGKWHFKTVYYSGYHELAYLHPDNFVPKKDIVAKYLNPDEPYFIIRFARFSAHHDSGVCGINDNLAKKLINILTPHGKIFITSERDLDQDFEKYRININPLEIHHILAYAKIYIGDSQTMAAEAGVLGTPFIRFNDFVGRIGYLNDLEINYNLGYGFKPFQEKAMFIKLEELLNFSNLEVSWEKKRKQMLEEKINTAEFIYWFIENYPASIEIIKYNQYTKSS